MTDGHHISDDADVHDERITGPANPDGPVDQHGAISAGAWAQPLTGFRGGAAVVVVIGHTFFATRMFPFTGVIHFISVIVPIFFVVSAYALYRPFIVAQVAREEQPSHGAFWWRRFLRIYPLYFVALSFYLVLLPGVRPQSGRVIDYLKLYGFLQIYDPDLVRFSGIPAAWFLCDEVVFYLMIPAIALFARWLAVRLAGPRKARRPSEVLRAHTLIACGMIIIGQASRTWLLLIDYPGATSLPCSNLDYYGFGILLAVASLREHNGLAIPRPVDWIRRRWWFAMAVLAVGIVAMNLVANVAGTTQSGWEDVQRYGVYSVMVVPFMIVMVLGFQDRGYNKWFSSARWGFLALLSLHVYLWHQLILGGIDKYWFNVASVRIGPRLTTGIVMCVLAAGLTIAWSAVLRPILDQPGDRWSRLVPRPADAGPHPRWMRPAVLGTALVLLVGGIAVSLEFGGSPMKAHGGVELIAVTSARPGDEIVASRDGGGKGATGTVDERGTVVLRDLAAGQYTVRQERGDRVIVERSATVLGVDDHPDPSFYEGRSLHAGLNQITTRDGTELSAFVTLPGPAAEGPYPTVVEYSGYQIADKKVTQPATAVARALGYATVGVNVRGSGCSGGAFEMLSDTQAADGYDVIETVARQDWVQGGSVGLVGFSYGGLGALEVASTAPPSLNSVVALSVYADAYDAIHPGGIANSGFPVGWMQDLGSDAAPAGAPWIAQRIADGDKACERNQLLHGQKTDLVARYTGDVPKDRRFDPLSPSVWAPKVKVPVFLASQLQDATIGTDLADIFDQFTSAPVTKMVLTNGTHGDAVAPQILRRMDQFLSLYAADEVPDAFDTRDLLEKTRPEVDPKLVPDGPDLPIALDEDRSVEEARTAYEAGPDVEILFESGNGGRPGAAAASTSLTFETWPPPAADAVPWYLASGGQLAAAASETTSSAQFTTDPTTSGVAYNIEGSDLATNAFSGWTQPDAEHAASWITEPLGSDTVLAGSTTLDLWVKFDAADADLQASLTEVTADGSETMVQVGWRRVSDAVDETNPNTWTKVRVNLGPVGQLVRQGSRLRLIVGTPGDGQAQWSFYPPPAGAATVDVGQGPPHASVLTLPTISGVTIDAPAPGCGDLRGQPCREYVPLENAEAVS
ncbi:MAG: Cocaine esterase [Ilumatobacteraceae bacterium]|nr:Cocaine esterase [Ilumatobacteraceae bacterium]